MLLSQSKDSNVTKQLSPPSTLLHIYEIMCQNTDNVVANLTRQAGTAGVCSPHTIHCRPIHWPTPCWVTVTRPLSEPRLFRKIILQAHS
ncbi:Hypothetical predicted protein [Scomber scombrus]|uniref:Uncharacterized protein n=1 Tax=Scomber scombrus TaxID=13677 RepID=A0AAV1MVK2_SCOSC